MIVAVLDGQLARADAGKRGACPECRGEVYARIPEDATRHWAHMPLNDGETRDCAADAGEMSEWHRAWQWLRTDEACIEVRRDIHRADATNEAGQVIEFQHSQIGLAAIESRETFWKTGTWVLDCTPEDGKARVVVRRKPEQPEADPWRAFSWTGRSWREPMIARAKWPVWLDLGGRLLQVWPVSRANGWIVPTEWFVENVLNGRRLTLKQHKLPVAGEASPARTRRGSSARQESQADLAQLVQPCGRAGPDELTAVFGRVVCFTCDAPVARPGSAFCNDCRERHFGTRGAA